jgi:hypothetical protein
MLELPQMIIIFASKKEVGIASVIRALTDSTSAKYDVCSCEDAMRRAKARVNLQSLSFVRTCNRRRLANGPDIVLHTL